MSWCKLKNGWFRRGGWWTWRLFDPELWLLRADRQHGSIRRVRNACRICTQCFRIVLGRSCYCMVCGRALGTRRHHWWEHSRRGWRIRRRRRVGGHSVVAIIEVYVMVDTLLALCISHIDTPPLWWALSRLATVKEWCRKVHKFRTLTSSWYSIWCRPEKARTASLSVMLASRPASPLFTQMSWKPGGCFHRTTSVNPRHSIFHPFLEDASSTGLILLNTRCTNSY